MAIGHYEIDLGRSARPEVFQHADPALFALLCAGAQCQHFFVASEVYPQSC